MTKVRKQLNQNQEQSNLPAKANVVTIDHLKKLNPVTLSDDPVVGNRFVDIYNKVNSSDEGNTVYNSEKFYYMKQLQENPALRDCTPMSLYGSFLDVAVNGLSFDPKKKLCYLIPRSVNVAPKGSPAVWEKRCYLEVSPDGEIAIRQMKGQIKHIDNPVIVYEGDLFELSTGTEGTQIKYTAKFPRVTGARIVGAFVRIVRPDNSIDFSYMMQDDINRLKGYSERQNNGTANKLYSSGEGNQIDTGFLMAKVKKHAFDSYPKVIKGDFAVAAVIEDKGKELDEPKNIYGLEENASSAVGAADSTSFDHEANGSPAAAAEGVAAPFTKKDEEAGF